MLIFLFRVFVATFVNEVSHHVAFAHVCASLVVSFGCWVMLVGGTFTYLGVLSRSREMTLTCHVRPAFLPDPPLGYISELLTFLPHCLLHASPRPVGHSFCLLRDSPNGSPSF